MRFLKHSNRVIILEAWKGRNDRFELRGVAFELLELLAAVLKNTANDIAQKIFSQHHNVVKSGIGDFGFNHPEFCQVAAGL